jgi:tetratricopeptide (TPR) repeat protein
LLVLFVLWVNVDSLFVLGLGTVALVRLGQLVDRAREKDRTKATGWVSLLGGLLVWLLVLAAVCLLNPTHLHAFVPPPELGGPGTVGSTAVSAAVTSPFLPSYFQAFGWRPVILAYFPLLVLGLIFFVLNFRGWRWAQFLPWLGLAVLSGWQARVIPFFAVVAGPTLAWNVQAVLAGRTAPRRWVRDWGHALVVVGGLALLVCAWPGWLGDPPFQPRRWAIETPPSLERGAAATQRWHEEGRLGPDTRGLYLSSDAACAFAWFCPEENALLDENLAAAVRGGTAGPQLRQQGIDHVIVYDRDRDKLAAALERLLSEPRQWPLLYVEGDLAIFGWRDPEQATDTDRFRGWELAVNRLAFHPAPDKRAPRKGPDREPKGRPWWEAFWKPAPRRPADTDEATFYRLYAEALRHSKPLARAEDRRRLVAWNGFQALGLLGTAGGWAAPASVLSDSLSRLIVVPSRLDALGVFKAHFDDTPPALLYLAVRAARRALAVTPDDAQAHFILGESYLRLLQSTRERVWVRGFRELAHLRFSQASTALNRSIALRPNFAPAHLSLGRLYEGLGHLDLALKHLRRSLELTRTAGSGAQGLAASSIYPPTSQEEVDQLAAVVDERRRAFAERSASVNVRHRALLARQLNLGGQALELLLRSDRAAFGKEGMRLELELMLQTGRARDVWEWIVPQDRNSEAGLKPSTYHWLRIQALAALGDYSLARGECLELGQALRDQILKVPEGIGQTSAADLRPEVARIIGQTVLDQLPSVDGGVPLRLLGEFLMGQADRRVLEFRDSLREEASTRVLAGLLALEQGATDEARQEFRKALALWSDDPSRPRIDFKGRDIAQHWLRRLLP